LRQWPLVLRSAVMGASRGLNGVPRRAYSV
jgi:hypothetical protein